MSELTEVNRTAFGVASIRAAETRRPDALFRDPYASVLVEGSPPRPAAGEAEQAQRRQLIAHVIVRTRFYDDLLRGAGHTQVVIVGAGLDARAWRLDWPADTVVYELDQPAVLDHKAARLPSPTVDRREVAVDLREDWPAALAAAGHDPARPTSWLVEGLLAYLDGDAARALLAAVTRLSAAGSVLGCERGQSMPAVPGTVSALWQGGVPGGADVELTRLGWAVTVVASSEVADEVGRPELAGTAAYVSAVRA